MSCAFGDHTTPKSESPFIVREDSLGSGLGVFFCPLKRKPSMNMQEEISSLQYLDDILAWLEVAPDGVLSAKEIYERIGQKYENEFSKADKRQHKLPNGQTRPKWMNNVDWAKARGTRLKLFATVQHKKQRWIVLLESTTEEWLVRAAKKKKRNSFKKMCPKCRTMARMAATECASCRKKFPAPNQKRRVLG